MVRLVSLLSEEDGFHQVDEEEEKVAIARNRESRHPKWQEAILIYIVSTDWLPSQRWFHVGCTVSGAASVNRIIVVGHFEPSH